MKNKFSVSNMSCASCSARVEKCVKNMNGVNEVRVNLLSGSMTVNYDENLVSDEEICKIVSDIGYPTAIYVKNNTEPYEIERVSIKKRLIISLIFFIPLFFLTMFVKSKLLITSLVEFILTTIVIVINRIYYFDGIKALFKRNPNMNSLIAIGTSATYFYGIYCILNNSYDLYIESAAMILIIITFGKYLEVKAKLKTKKSINLLYELAPKKAVILKENEKVEVNAESVCEGDICVLKNGYIIPADGVIISGNIIADQSIITGESVPVTLGVGDKVISASKVIDGYCEFKVESAGDDTAFSKIIDMVENSVSSKPHIARIADKISGYFVPVVMSISAITFIVWMITEKNINTALINGVSVLVISCPCALGLATPLSVTVGIGKGAKEKILINNAEILEMLCKTDTVFFDKTGTVTKGKPKVEKTVILDNNCEFLKLAASLESKSQHIISEAIINEYGSYDFYTVEDFKVINGSGVSGIIEGKKYYLGNSKINENVSVPDFEFVGTVVYLFNEASLLGYIIIGDELKKEAKETVSLLNNMKIETVMLTGDNEVISEKIAEECGFKKVYSEMLPDEKADIIKKYTENNKLTVMVGDGVNDAPALTNANIGIAVGGGSDVTVECADIVLIRSNILDVVKAIKLSKITLKNIKENLIWAFCYNLICIPLATGMFYKKFGLKLTPMISSAAMMCSSLLVVTNALRLNFAKISKK